MEAQGISWSGDSGPAWQESDEDVDATPVSPPVSLLVLAGATAVGSLILWLPVVLELHYLGYVLGTFVTLGLLAAFKRKDLQLRQSPFYSPQDRLQSFSILVAIAGVLAAVAHIVPIAMHWAA